MRASLSRPKELPNLELLSAPVHFCAFGCITAVFKVAGPLQRHGIRWMKNIAHADTCLAACYRFYFVPVFIYILLLLLCQKNVNLYSVVLVPFLDEGVPHCIVLQLVVKLIM